MGSGEGPIGIFDSGVGGLTVFRRLAEYVPGESIIYLGDTARVPYGTKSAGTVIRYARACASLLIDRGVKMLVVACNTASAYALEALREELDVPVLGVIEPGAASAVRSTRNKRVGVIGTAGTISSGQYERAIQRLAPDVQVFSKPCPLFVPLAEEGWTDGDVPRRVAREYLGKLAEQSIDTLVLGCTHYPLLKSVIAETMGNGVTLVDSAESTAAVARDMLGAAGAGGHNAPSYQFLVSDAPESFARVGKRFLGWDVEHVEWVDC
ncbi:MAG TPA: glutamate racemase [Candidatus Bathyarchaeia archaeon]|nr:glutamate racemase [Candidatus Bathyarchaeia archaeon]